MKIFKTLALASVVAATMVGCASTSNTAPADVTNGKVFFGSAEAVADSAHNVKFPAVDKADFSQNNYKGAWPNWSNIAQLEHGMSKDQLYDLIGRPHYKEGLFGVKEWNYVFNYRDADNNHQVCQMQVQFDKNMTVQAYYWQGADCEKQAAGPKTITQQTIVNNIIQQAPQGAELKETFELSADALFRFDKSSTADMLPAGRAKLDELADKLKAYGNAPISAIVIGHTDRFGDEEYNINLSKKRADTVVAYLLSKGVQPTVLSSIGAGELMPVKFCANGPKPQVVDCLQPNRRVEVKIYSR